MRTDEIKTKAIKLLADVDTVERADLIDFMLTDFWELAEEYERLNSLAIRAQAIINDAIMHGMPVTEEVADVRNSIYGLNAASCGNGKEDL